MKKKTLLCIFLIVFITIYMMLCFAVPGLRIKLEAEPVEYFLASISHMVFFKTVISSAVALISMMIPILIKRKRN
ncbi:MAG: hypothetical protein GX222_04775 [Ruminococcaceae bacterium]|nr:hypothetical protein [Oscillospiraceae bacterium]